MELDLGVRESLLTCLRSFMITVSVASLGVVSRASPKVGGIIFSTPLTLILLPALYRPVYEGRSAANLLKSASATS